MKPAEAITELDRIIQSLITEGATEEIEVACVRMQDAKFWLKRHIDNFSVSDEDFQKLLDGPSAD